MAEAARARGEPVAGIGPAPGFRELKWLKPVYAGDTIDYASEVIETRAVRQPARLGPDDHPLHRRQPARRAGDVVRQHHLRRAPAGESHDRRRCARRRPPSTTSAARMGVACGAHALHDGYTDLIYVMLPIWQAEFGLGYAALGLMKTVFSGTLAGLQIPVELAGRAVRRAAGAGARHRARRPRLLPRRLEPAASRCWWRRCSSAGSAPARSIRSPPR